jgi:hypothetical protein
MASARFPSLLQAGAFAVAVAAAVSFAPHPAISAPKVAAPVPLPSPEALLQLIRNQFRSHRPPPPFVTYTIIRKQQTAEGYPDYLNSYTEHVWVRSTDRAALARRVYRDEDRGPLTFERPAFNEPRDPGPPTTDLFERAPVRQTTDLNADIPTPEPSGALQNIATVRTVGETAYKVVKVVREGDLIHLSVEPFRDVERNRLREIYVSAKTYELTRVVATDRLYIDNGISYGVIFTVDLQMLQGRPVVTRIHGVVGDGYNGDGATVDYWFNDVRFPASLPDWYFDPHQYAAHTDDAPI